LAFHPAASTIKLVIHAVCDGTDNNNILHYKYTGAAPNAATLVSFLAAWSTAFLTEWLAAHSAQYALQSITATDIATAGGATAVQNYIGPGNTGTNTGGVALPNNVALAISLRTGLTGRSNRGRFYLGGLNTGEIANEVAQSAFQSAINTLVTHLISLTVSGIFDLAVTSLLHATSQIITGYVLDTTADSMRRRLPGRGN